MGRTNVAGSLQVVPVMEFGFTEVFARRCRWSE